MIVREAFNKVCMLLKWKTLKSQIKQKHTHCSTKVNKSQWHQRFCHVNIKNIKELFTKNLVRDL